MDVIAKKPFLVAGQSPRRSREFKGQQARLLVVLDLHRVLFGLSLVAELIANDRPIIASYKGEILFPIVVNYPEEKFGGFLRETDYRSDFIEEENQTPMAG